MRLLLFISLISISLTGHSQNYADKEVYLVDSLEYDNISPDYQKIIDYYIDYYHNTDNDLYKISVIHEIVRNCWDNNVWPKYNRWVYKEANEKLKEDLTDSLEFMYGRFRAGSVYYTAWGHFYKTEYEKAIQTFARSRDLYLEHGDSIGAANAIDNIGSVYSTKGEMAKALEFHVEGLKIREIIQDTLGLGASYNAIGIIHMMHGDYNQAIKDYKKAIAFHEHVEFWSGLSSEYSNLGATESFIGHHDKALEYHLQSYNIKANIEDKQGMAISLTNLANLSVMNGDTATAFEYQNYGLELSEELQDQRGISSALCHLGYFHLLKDEYEEGIEHLDKSLEIAKEVGAHIDTRKALVNLFKAYLWQRKYDKAEVYLQELVEIRKKDIKTNFSILAEREKELYFNTMAEEYQNLYAYGNLTYKNNPEITRTLYDNTIMLKGLLLKSSAAMRETILNSEDTALIAEYEKWIELKVNIADAYARNFDSDSLEKVATTIEAKLVQKSADFDKFYQEPQTSWKDIQNGLAKNEAAIEFIRYPKDLQNPESEIIYSALLLKAKSKQPELIQLCTEDALEQVLGKISANNLDHVKDIYGTSANSNAVLSELIWEPLKNKTEGIEKIYFAPVGLLHKVAFAAISINNEQLLSDRFHLVQLNSTSGLLNKEQIDFNTSTQATLFGGVKYHTDSSEHVIWTYLPGTLEEIDSIKNILDEQLTVNYFKEYAANEENFKKSAGQSTILHIASHGFFYPDPETVRKEAQIDIDMEEIAFRGGASNYGIWNFVNNENPLMRSGIALAAANDAWQRDAFATGEDGVLSAQEVSNLNMTKTKLVVLSACETGLGDIKGSEGVYGLQRAFKMAGVRYLIMSLWQVPDEETAEFMTLFYKELMASKNIRSAFDKAQSVMREKYDPYYWAAFVLIE
ncbi:MAG: CHAT domain-containing tetratricopeptide repeat protein [Crocinitomicaceae bacterium]